MAATRNDFGWFGQFSLAGFLVLGLLAILEAADIASWPLSVEATAALAIVAGIGAALLWFGNDPTADTRTGRT